VLYAARDWFLGRDRYAGYDLMRGPRSLGHRSARIV